LHTKLTLFTLGIQSWTRDVVTPAYHEKRNSLNPEELKAFEKEMIDYYEGHVGDRDRLKVDAGKRAMIMSRDIKLYERKVSFTVLGPYLKLNLHLYRPVPTTNLGLSLPGTCAPQSLRMVEQSLRIRFLVHLMLPEHSLINMKTWPVILLTLPTMCSKCQQSSAVEPLHLLLHPISESRKTQRRTELNWSADERERLRGSKATSRDATKTLFSRFLRSKCGRE
jgi:hypothetical protein